ncbi:MAG TPA: PRC-barrel domain-containing protein [Gaiellaceae bacterium]|nr:PRC-barrel domain-containing protein [Gaiellaceae bacterium]
MPTDPPPELVDIGRVGRPHGVDGAFVVEQASDDERRFEVGAEIVVDGTPTRVTVSRRVGGGRRAIKLDRPVARGAVLHVPRAQLSALPDDTFYVADLVGLDVVDADGSKVGRVRDVVPGPANDALELDTGLLLPLVEDCIRKVDLAGRRVLLNPGYTD